MWHKHLPDTASVAPTPVASLPQTCMKGSSRMIMEMGAKDKFLWVWSSFEILHSMYVSWTHADPFHAWFSKFLFCNLTNLSFNAVFHTLAKFPCIYSWHFSHETWNNSLLLTCYEWCRKCAERFSLDMHFFTQIGIFGQNCGFQLKYLEHHPNFHLFTVFVCTVFCNIL